jgi:hypothetical protein
MPPIEIIVTWRDFRLRLSPLSVVVEASVAIGEVYRTGRGRL